MKRFLYLILLVSIANATLKSQTTSQIRFDNSNALSDFEGQWIWYNGIDTLRIFLKKELISSTVTSKSAEGLVGFHEYKQGSYVIESSYPYINTTYLDGNSTILVSNRDNGDYVWGSIKDISRNKFCSLSLIMNSAKTQIEWVVKNNDGVRIPPNPNITLPLSITLTRQ